MLRLSLSRAAAAALAAFAALTLVSTAAAQAPPGYYANVDTSSANALRSTLHAVIDDHQRFPYTASGTDTWDILELADEDPANAGRILDVYKNESYPKQGGGNSFYDREHVWPKSYGFPDDSGSNYPFTDCHGLRLCNGSYNSSRGNKPFRDCSASCSELTTVVNDGAGGGSGTYPGQSNWTAGFSTAGTWEAWAGRKGDVARSILYFDVRYEGGTHGATGASEPDLVATDDLGLIAASSTGSNESVAYMGLLATLLEWHAADPPDAKELDRNDTIFAFQGNRNPFVDHPEWVDILWGAGATAPAPTDLAGVSCAGVVALDWSASPYPGVTGYGVYRSNTSGVGFSPLPGSPVTAPAYLDTTAQPGATHYYVVTAIDGGGESAFSTELPIAVQGAGGSGGTPWINEFHYDNVSGDVGEFVEIAGPAGTDLTNWTVVGYNGAGGGPYDSIALSGQLADQGGCVGAAAFPFSGMQNGSPDGLALVDPLGTVVEFLSYEGNLTAIGGAADGLTAVDVGVAESNATPVGHSLQRTGSGSSAGDFAVWAAPQAETPGAANAGQTFAGGCATAVVTYGCGVNPAGSLTLVAGTPSIGATLTFGIDNPTGAQNFGSVPILFLSLSADAAYPCGTLLSTFGMGGPGLPGELLISAAPGQLIEPALIGSFWFGAGSPSLVDVAVPFDCALAGLVLYAQGAIVDPFGPTGIGLTEALRITLPN